MPRLTLADALHNLPYSLAERDWILEYKFRNWDHSFPVTGLGASLRGIVVTGSPLCSLFGKCHEGSVFRQTIGLKIY
jgi:hypothetical protein